MNSLMLLVVLAAPGDALDWSFGGAPSPALDWSFGVAAVVSVQPPPPPPAIPTSAAMLKKWPDVDFSKECFDEAGVPYELAPWLIAIQTESVPFFDPPRPLPAPTAGGALSRQFGLPRWNGLIGGVDGTPNTGAAPRGTLLWCKGNSGYAVCLSQGPENLVTKPSAAVAPQPAYGQTFSQPYYSQPVYSQPYYSQPMYGHSGQSYYQPYYQQGSCAGGVCLPSGR